MQDIAQGLERLREQGVLNLEALAGNESFVSTVMDASAAAIRTHLYIGQGPLPGMVHMLAKCTELGRDYLDFIESPIDD